MILDSHVHCGISLKFDIISYEWEKAGINGGVLFSPVEEIYNRYTPYFYDSEEYKISRKKVHNYLEKLVLDKENLIAFYFVWNDFKIPNSIFKGIKWHRHSNEPEYDYKSDKCKKFIKHICENRLPVIIEEEFENTIEFIKRIDGETIIIIPHLGFLNGGYEKLKSEGIFEESNVYADTALADIWEIEDFAQNFGINKLLFGSDFPFGSPNTELQKIKEIFDENSKEFKKITFENILKIT